MDSTNSLFIKKTKSIILPLFRWIHIQHLINRWSPFLPRKELCWATFPFLGFGILMFFKRTQDIGMLFFAQIYCVSYLDMAFKQGALFRKLSFYRLWHSAQLSYKDIIKRDFLFSGKSRFIFILVQMSRADLPFQLSILATQPGLISGTSPRICM